LTPRLFVVGVESDAPHQVEDEHDDEKGTEYAAADVHVKLLSFPNSFIGAWGPQSRLRAAVHRRGIRAHTSGNQVAPVAGNSAVPRSRRVDIAIAQLASVVQCTDVTGMLPPQ
jgi:hypothetical protein